MPVLINLFSFCIDVTFIMVEFTCHECAAKSFGASAHSSRAENSELRMQQARFFIESSERVGNYRLTITSEG